MFSLDEVLEKSIPWKRSDRRILGILILAFREIYNVFNASFSVYEEDEDMLLISFYS